MARPITIGTRGSSLALWQAEWVRAQIEHRFPGAEVELAIIKTQGDKILDVPLAQVGGKGLFVKEIEDALLDGRVDVAVHSMKDMPADIPDGLAIGAVPEREIPTDVLISRGGLPLREIAPGGVIGTSSLRRAAQIRHLRGDLEVVPLRGNVETRIAKLERGRPRRDRPGRGRPQATRPGGAGDRAPAPRPHAPGRGPGGAVHRDPRGTTRASARSSPRSTTATAGWRSPASAPSCGGSRAGARSRSPVMPASSARGSP